MSRFTGSSIRRLPGLLLLGLLALLLWGQCGSVLFPRTTRHEPALLGWVASTDSLRTTAPATLYLSLGLRNTLHKTATLKEVDGALVFNGRTYPFSATATLHHTPLAHEARVTQAIAIRLRLPADSLALLRAALATEHMAGSGPRLAWRASYSVSQYPNGNLWGQTSGYLPLLKPKR
jgi:hypothetical protein